MLIFDENNKAIIIQDIYTPTLFEYFWVLDLAYKDFKLSKLVFLEEVTCATLQLSVLGFDFCIPANWHILIVDPETMRLDVIEAHNAMGKDFQVLLYGPTRTRHDAALLQVTNYFPHRSHANPVISKQQMLCHPVDENTWINISPSNPYNKYLKNMDIGDII